MELAGYGAQGLTLHTATALGTDHDAGPHARRLDAVTVHELKGAGRTRPAHETHGTEGHGVRDVRPAIGEE